MEQATHAPHVPPPNRAAQIQQAVHALSLKFMNCHECLADHTCMLATLLREAESRGILLHEAFALADAQYWLQHIDWQTKFLRVVLAFTQAPSRTTLRPLIELYGRDRERMRVEVEILARQLEYRLAHFAQPDDSTVKTAVLKNEKRVLAAYLHDRSGYGGAALARLFKVPRSTAYGWLAWFESLPEGLRTGILAFLDSQAVGMAVVQIPNLASAASVDAGKQRSPTFSISTSRSAK